MPIDPNIALGVRPIEQPNMLGQMAQAMQIRQANQEYQSNNALKDFYAQGGDLSKPEDQRRLMSTVGAKGAELIAKQFALEKTKAEVKKLGYDNVESEFKQSRQLLTSIDPDSPNAGSQLLAWHEANHKSPIMGSVLAASGISAESSRASIEAAIAKGPAGIREAIRRSSLGQADYQKELMQTERSHIAAAPGHRQAAVAEQGSWSNVIVGRRVMEKNNRTGEMREVQDPYSDTGGTVTVGPITNLPDTSTGGGVVTGGGGTPAAPNTLAAPSVNALRNPPVVATAPAPKTRPPVTNPLMVEEKPVWNEKAGVYMLPPSAENPQGKIIEMPAVQEAVQKRAATQTLKVAGFDPKTGTDEISELIKKSTSGLGENWMSKAWGAVTGAGTSGAKAIAALETRANQLTLDLAPNGSLGAGFSNDDRNFMLAKLGDVSNPNAPMNVRLAAWEDVMERAARTAGVPYPKSAKSTGDITIDPALAEALKRYPVKK